MAIERMFVLVHGMPGDASQLAPLASLLAEHGRVELLDLPDCGRAADVFSIDPDEYVAHVRDLVASYAPSSVTLVGNSFGGWLVARLAGDRPPANLERIVSISGYVRHPEKDIEPFDGMATELEAGRLVPAALVDVALARWVPAGASPSVIEHVTALLSSTSAARCARGLRRLIGSAGADRAAHRSEIPATIIHARGDGAIPIACGEELNATFPNSEMHVLETDSHYLAWTHARECVEAIVG